MATYAIGDIQGCHAEFVDLLGAVSFDPARDRLWLLGDLVNRGPDSLKVMELVMSLEGRTITVLGNHDLHFLAIHYGGHSPVASDTFHDLLGAPDVAWVADWLRAPALFPRGCLPRLCHGACGHPSGLVHGAGRGALPGVDGGAAGGWLR